MSNQTPTTGTTGLQTQLPGVSALVSELAAADGGIDAGHFVEPDVDEELLRFNPDDTPLMNLMLRAKKVMVKSPEVVHYVADDQRHSVTTTEAIAESSAQQTTLPLAANDQNMLRAYTTLLVQGVDGYDDTGAAVVAGKPLMLFVTGQDTTTGLPVVRAVNGPKANPTDEVCTIPAIPVGTTMVILSNALYETQKEVEPDLFLPQPTTIYLQKRGMNQVVSDYFDSQRKQIPFSKAILAEQAIQNYKVRANRSLWAGRKGKFSVQTKIGMQTIYSTEGIRWQFRRKLAAPQKWTVEKIIALAKMFFTGEDVPKTAILLAGKNLLESIQCVDYSQHPEVQVTAKTNTAGWLVTNFHTVFGDIEIKREPTLDRLGWSNSGALLGENRLVHYQRVAEHSYSERVEGEEATRTGILSWDALALKGTCHIWIDGESDGTVEAGMTNLTTWTSASGAAPEGSDLIAGMVYYMMQRTTLGTGLTAPAGTLWQYDGSGWTIFEGDLF